MTNESGILQTDRWLYFKIYRQADSGDTWRTQLDWYHHVLRSLVKPWMRASAEIKFLFFGIYGPRDYEVENVQYEKRIGTQPKGKVNYVRLRAYIPEDLGPVKSRLATAIESDVGLVWDYEILEFRVRDDLGDRYGRLNDGTIDDRRTVMFIRYWDAACRYVLEILTGPGNWDSNIDVWGVPHLVNNSLGGWLRASSMKCQQCAAPMYMATSAGVPQQLSQQLVNLPRAPISVFVCPQCSSVAMASASI